MSRYEDMIDHHSYTHNLPSWERVTFWVRNIPVVGEEFKWLYERSYIWTAEKDMKIWLVIAVIYIT